MCYITDNDMEHIANDSAEVSQSYAQAQSPEEHKEPFAGEAIEVDRLSNSKHAPSHDSLDHEGEIDEDPSHLTSRPEYSAQRLAEIAPKLNFIAAGNNQLHKVFDKSEGVIFEKLYKNMKYKYEDLMRILHLYSEAVIGADEAESLIKDYFIQNQDLKDQFMNLLYSREVTRRLNSWFTKPISEFSFSNCKIIDKSYTTFPNDFPDII
mmetsp:Transcript_19123/g.22061  ORF Transcript_19123/g.22061 Transcript_19123/m.22061 type:complete len:208 (+) Transcript_19123:488-1111(+)